MSLPAPNEREPLTEPRTGLITRLWARFLSTKWTEYHTLLAGTQNDVAFEGADSLICRNALALTLNGLVAGVPGQRLVIFADAAVVNVANEAAASIAEHRIVTNTGATLVLAAGTGRAHLVYDGFLARWHVLTP